MKYERLTKKTVGSFGYDLKDFEHKPKEFNDYDAFYAYKMAVKRLGELEDKIERGELISTQLKDRSEQEFAFFVNHSRSVRKLFADELEARLQDAVALGNITRKVYDVIESEINYCLGEVKQ